MDTHEDYLQLISDDPAISSNALVQVPKLNREYVADSRGQAAIDITDIDMGEELNWQIKMPDAVFSLQPLKYEPDRTEYCEEVILTTKNNDRIRVTFEGKSQGKNISVEILELDGKDDFGAVTVVVSQDDVTSRDDLKPHKKATFEISDADATIGLRLYQR
jgi:hypothetical protein